MGRPSARRDDTALRASTRTSRSVGLRCVASTVLAPATAAGPPWPTAAQVTHQPFGTAAGGRGRPAAARGLHGRPQTVIPRTLGANEPGYAVRHASSGGLQLAGAGITAAFTHGGRRVHDARRFAARVAGGARAWRPDATRCPCHADRPGERVLYRDGARPTSGSVNGPLGLEQGFTLAQRPAGVAGIDDRDAPRRRPSPTMIDGGIGLFQSHDFNGSHRRLARSGFACIIAESDAASVPGNAARVIHSGNARGEAEASPSCCFLVFAYCNGESVEVAGFERLYWM